MSVEALKNEFVPKFLLKGEQGFYRNLLALATKLLMNTQKGTYKGTSPELLFLRCYEQFIILYRREGEDIYLDLARVFRRAAHKVYRTMLRSKMTEKNSRFLNLV
jgi:hypothetical protein